MINMQRAVAPTVTLVTARFELRTLARDADPRAFQRWARDPRLMTPLNLPARVLTSAQIADYWGGFDNATRFFFGIFERATGEHVGFWMIEGEAQHRVGDLHLLIDRRFQRRLVVQETSLVLFDWLFDVAGFAKLVTRTLTTNTDVIALMGEARWTREAHLREEISAPDGSCRLDQLRFGLLPRDWRAMRADRAAFVARIASKRFTPPHATARLDTRGDVAFQPSAQR